MVAGTTEEIRYVVSVLGSTVLACRMKNTDRDAAAARRLLQAKSRWRASDVVDSLR